MEFGGWLLFGLYKQSKVNIIKKNSILQEKDMKKIHRKILNRLMDVCNELGGIQDLTACCTAKLHDRQRAHSLVYRVLYGVLSDCTENIYRKEDMDLVEESLNKLEELAKKKYPDRNGYM